MSYGFFEHLRELDLDVPLIAREELLTICKEIDEETPEAETDAFIQGAHTFLYNTLDGWGVPISLMRTIETYLAAHFAAITYPAVQREGLGPLSTTYFGRAELGLQHTRYGQMAISLDPTARLKKLSDGEGARSVNIRSLGSGKLLADYR